MSPAGGRWSLGYAVAGALGIGAYFTVGSPVAAAVVYDGLVLSGAAAVVVGVRRHRPDAAWAWRCLAASVALLACGDFVWDVYDLVLGRAVPQPSTADAFYLASYPFLVAGVLALVHSRSGRDFDSLLDGLTLACAAVVVLIEPVIAARASVASGAGHLVAAAYVLGDLAVLGVVCHLAIAPTRSTPGLRLLMLSLVALLVGDLAFAWLGSAYETASWVDVTWLAHAVVLGAAALHPSMRSLSQPLAPIRPRLTRRRILLTCVALLAFPIDTVLNGTPEGGVGRILARFGLLVVVAIRLVRLATINERAEARLTSILENSADAIVYGGRNGEVLALNPAAERLFGWTEGIVGRPLAAVFPDVPELAVDGPLSQLSAGSALDVVIATTRDDGTRSVATARFTTAPNTRDQGAWVAIGRDTTKQLLADSTARALGQELDPAAAFSLLAEAIGDLLPADGPALLELGPGDAIRPVIATRRGTIVDLSLSRLGPSARRWLDPARRAVMVGGVDSPIAPILERLEASIAITVPVFAPDHEIAAVVIVTFPEAAPIERLSELVSAIQPVIERTVQNMLVFERQRAMTKALREAERLKADFLRMVGHDLRTPLAAIRLASEVLGHESYELSAERRHHLTAMLCDNVDALGRLVGDVTDAMRIEDGLFPCSLVPLDDPAAMIERAVHSVGETHRVVPDIEPLPRLHGDEARLRQVVVNLVVNGLRYSPTTSPVHVRAWAVDREMRLSVADRGIGIAAEHLPLLFRRFSRIPANGHGESDGAGLGLFIARGIVEAHGGTIWVDSTVGEGSTFHVSIPAAAGTAAAGPRGNK